MDLDARHLIRNAAELSALYGPPRERSVRKQIDHLDDHCRAFIAASPLLFIGTQAPGPEGVADTSPRGGDPGFVKVADDHTLLIPDHRGNNRLDTMHNLIRNPRTGILFVVPGITYTLRVNGEAVISREPGLIELFETRGNLPRTVLVVTVKEAYVHCSRALLRAEAWNPEKFAAASAIPSFGTIMGAHTCGFVDGKALDEENALRMPQTLY